MIQQLGQAGGGGELNCTHVNVMQLTLVSSYIQLSAKVSQQ